MQCRSSAEHVPRPGADKGGAGVGVGPCVTAVGGAVDLVGSVAAATGSAAAAFVHAGDVHVSPVTRSPVICTLRMNEVLSCRSLVQVRPLSVEQRTRRGPHSVVPGDIHPPVKGRRWIHVGPTGFAVVFKAGGNAVMGPAIRVPGSGQLLLPPKPSVAAAVNPDGVPSGGWAVISSEQRDLPGVREGALTVGLGEAGKG